ncbi:MAG: pyridoxal phosphate-dependent aminotransferase [Solirubrobacteraceae bacterium]
MPDELTPRKEPRLAAGVAQLGTESAFAVLARARELERQGRLVVHLEIGQPDFPTPEHIAEAGIAAIRRGETGYTPSAGIAEFREAIAGELARTREIPVTADRVLVANGAKLLLFMTVVATCGAGDEVIYPDPGFPIYESAIRWAGAMPVALPLPEELDFSFSLEDLADRLSARTKLVIVNSPNNPTGGVASRDDLRRAAELILDTPAWVLSDEVYRQIAYGDEIASIAGVPGMLDRTVLLDGLSKTYAMTGWRCGYAAVPEPLVDPLTRLMTNSVSCVPGFVQAAGIAALTGPQDCVGAMVEEFAARRELIVAGLNALPGVSCLAPRGAFYVFPDVSETSIPSKELAGRLLEEAGVALLAGEDFGAHGEGHLRISYANSREQLELGLERIREFLS